MHKYLEDILQHMPYKVSINELANDLHSLGSKYVKNYIILTSYIEFMNLVENVKSDTGLQLRKRNQWYKQASQEFLKYGIKLNVKQSEQMTIYLSYLINWIKHTEKVLAKQNEIHHIVQNFESDSKKEKSYVTRSVVSKIIDMLTNVPGLTDYLEKQSGQEPDTVLEKLTEVNLATYNDVQEYRASIIFEHCANLQAADPTWSVNHLVQEIDKYFPWYIVTDHFKQVLQSWAVHSGIGAFGPSHTVERIPTNCTKNDILEILHSGLHRVPLQNLAPEPDYDICEVITFIALNKDFGKNTQYLNVLSRIDIIPASEYSFDLSGRSPSEISEIIKNIGINIVNERSYELYTKVCNLYIPA